ncbi:MAG: site-specific integrase [Oscillospiraceae bacterium]|nr:site-specific integrase [Oscillospiraceae bacterium]
MLYFYVFYGKLSIRNSPQQFNSPRQLLGTEVFPQRNRTDPQIVEPLKQVTAVSLPSLLTFNPADQVTFPRQNKQDRFHGTAYTAEQAVQLLEAFRGDVLEPAVILGLCYGLRWSDIDFEAGTLTVQNTVTRMKTLIEHEQTKSAASKRVLYLMPGTITYLRQLRQQQEENHWFLSEGYIISDHIRFWPDGRPVSPDYVSQHFKKVLTRNGLDPIRFHDLRHTAGSLLMNNGASEKQVQEFLGHEKVSTTLDIYTHIDTEAKQRTAFS